MLTNREGNKAQDNHSTLICAATKSLERTLDPGLWS